MSSKFPLCFPTCIFSLRPFSRELEHESGCNMYLQVAMTNFPQPARFGIWPLYPQQQNKPHLTNGERNPKTARNELLATRESLLTSIASHRDKREARSDPAESRQPTGSQHHLAPGMCLPSCLSCERATQARCRVRSFNSNSLSPPPCPRPLV